MTTDALDDRVAAVRQFNRFFTREIGVLREGLLNSPYPLTQARVLYELAHRDGATGTALARDLGLDAGYLSRTLARLEENGLIEKVRADDDGRQRILSLTNEGHAAFAELDRRSRDEVVEMLAELAEGDQRRLLAAMRTIEGILGAGKGFKFARPFVLRSHEPGDMGWVVHRHGALYAQEYRWDEHFEALVAGIVSRFIEEYDPARDHCWIAEMNGEIVGSAFVVKTDDPALAKLRLLLVEPKARGLGLGGALVEECIRFARRAGYRKMTLWTNSVLVAARHIYAKAGFVCVSEGQHHSFGHDLTEEVWELDL